MSKKELLVRFMDNYVDDFINGHLYMNSLKFFWGADIENMKPGQHVPATQSR